MYCVCMFIIFVTHLWWATLKVPSAALWSEPNYGKNTTYPIWSISDCASICPVNVSDSAGKRVTQGLNVMQAIVQSRSPSQHTSYTLYSVLVSCFCLYGPFNCISFHKFSRQLSAFSLRSSGLSSALLVLSNTYFFTKVSLSPFLREIGVFYKIWSVFR